MKQSPEIRVYVYPSGSIPRRTSDGFVMATILSDTMNLGMSDGAGLAWEAQNPTTAAPWYLANSNGAITGITGLDFVRFFKDGSFVEGASYEAKSENSDISGFILEGRKAPLDLSINNYEILTDHFLQHWEQAGGAANTWQTVWPPGTIAARIWNRGKATTAKARSVGLIPPNRSFGIDVAFQAKDKAGPLPGWSVAWGGKYKLTGRHGMAWLLEIVRNGVLVPVWRGTNMPLCDLKRGVYDIRVRIIGGRGVITINNRSRWWLETSEDGDGGASVQDVTWGGTAGGAQMQINAHNVRCSFGLSLIKYADSDDNPFTGSFTARAVCKTALPGTSEVTGRATGWRKRDTSLSVAGEVGTNEITAEVTLTANTEGIDTPLCNKATARVEPTWVTGSFTPIDIAPCVRSMTLSMAQPPITPGSTVTIEVDREMLTRLIPAWALNVKDDNPLEIQARWRYSDGSYGSWYKMFKGYLIQVNKSVAGYNDGRMRLVGSDPIWRLQGDNARINYKWPPLDIFFAEMEDSNTGEFSFYDYDAVREIVRFALGTAEADDLQVVMPDSISPLLSTATDTAGILNLQSALANQPLTQNGFIFPPPINNDALNWIYDINENNVFYYGHPAGYTDAWPRPVYGRLPSLLAGMPTIAIRDRVVFVGDENLLIQSYDTETRADRVVNAVEVHGAPTEGTLSAILPSNRIAFARLPAGDYNAQERSWQKLRIYSHVIASYPGAAEVFARNFMSLLENVPFQWPSYVFRGEPTVTWGVKITTDVVDNSINLDGKTFRAERIEHVWTFEAGEPPDWVTEAFVRPINAENW